MLSQLRRWLGRGHAVKQCPAMRVVLITRRDCHLCDDAWQLLEAYQKRYAFALEKIDVDSEPELVGKYGQCVPVVLVDGQMRFRGRVNEVLLRRLLDARL